MRISDWSSDVCSSDLAKAVEGLDASGILGLSAMPQLPDRHRRVGRVLIDVRIAVQRRLDIGGVQRMLRRETVEAAAPHEEDQVDQHIALGAQFALVSGLTHDARARKPAPVAKARAEIG